MFNLFSLAEGCVSDQPRPFEAKKTQKMKGPYRQPRPGEVFWLFRDKLHYIGVAESREDRVHVFWAWNKWKRRRWYKTMPDLDLEMAWEYMRKTSKKV